MLIYNKSLLKKINYWYSRGGFVADFICIISSRKFVHEIVHIVRYIKFYLCTKLCSNKIDDRSAIIYLFVLIIESRFYITHNLFTLMLHYFFSFFPQDNLIILVFMQFTYLHFGIYITCCNATCYFMNNMIFDINLAFLL